VSHAWPRSLAALAVAPALAAAVFCFVAWVEARRDRTASAVLEAAYATQDLAARIAVCSDRARFDTPAHAPRTLPPTSTKVPSVLPRGHELLADARDWEDPAFRCADYRILEPQSFQLQWVLYAKPTAEWFAAEGVVRAEADLDGDGTVDHVVETGVACTPDFCETAPDVLPRTLP
jgi:hypothetical protein